MINFESQTKWQIRLATLIIFALGFAAGGFALNSYNLWSGAATKVQTKHERYQEAFNSLGLSDPQRTEIEKIVVEIRENIQQVRQESEPRIEEIRLRNDARLQTVLTADQWAKFQERRESIRQTEK